MLKSGLAATVALSLVEILVLWVAGQAFGFRISLAGSLALSIGLTILLNVLLTAFSRRNRRGY